jgi:VWFA-related protein
MALGMALGIALLAVISVGQTLSPDEVRISGGPYHPQAPTLRVQTNEVRVGVVVRDDKGHIISGLKSTDFKIYDDGKEQPISEFSIETRQSNVPSSNTATPSAPAAPSPNLQAQVPPRPRYVALYFDDLSTPFGDMGHVQLAAENFVQHGVAPGDQIGLFTASGLQTVAFTTSSQDILDAIEKLRFHGRTIKSTGCPYITPYDAYEISTEPLPPIMPTYVPQVGGSPTYERILLEAVKCNCADDTNVDTTCPRQQEVFVRGESKQIWDSVRQMSQDILGTVQAVVDYLAKKPGERVLVMASSGFLTGTLEIDVDKMVDSALRAGVVINALDAKGLYTLDSAMDPNHGYTDDADDRVVVHDLQNFGPAMANSMAAMADFVLGTGGRFFRNRNDLIAGYYSLAAAPQTEYLLGFAPENEKRNDRFHKLKVEVEIPGKFDVQARPGYFTPTREPSEVASNQAASEPTPEEKIDAEVRASDQRNDFPLSVTEQPRTASNGSQELRIQVHIDIEKVPFELQQDRHVEMLTFVIALFDAQGNMAAGKEAQMQLALKPDSFARFSKSGIDGTMSLEAPPGAYRLRVVVEEALHGEMSAATQNVQVP